MNEADWIRRDASRRGITRLCHFSPSRNLAHILSGRQGILASRHFNDDEAAIYNPTDKLRLDGYRDHVNCSIQYPNAWYFSTARQDETLFKDWVVILVDVRYLWQIGTNFCPINAASGHGQFVASGREAYERLFDGVIEGTYTFRRGPAHPAFLPTDEQAEVLIPDRITIPDLLGVVVKDDDQAAREVAALRLQSLDIPRLLVVPEFFNARELSDMLRSGGIPREQEYYSGGTSD